MCLGLIFEMLHQRCGRPGFIWFKRLWSPFFNWDQNLATALATAILLQKYACCNCTATTFFQLSIKNVFGNRNMWLQYTFQIVLQIAVSTKLFKNSKIFCDCTLLQASRNYLCSAKSCFKGYKLASQYYSCWRPFSY